jgi:hypothetical protein
LTLSLIITLVLIDRWLQLGDHPATLKPQADPLGLFVSLPFDGAGEI